jgi:hypothetical protein
MSDTIIAALITGLLAVLAAVIIHRATIQAAHIQAKGKTSQVGDAGEEEARKSS